VNKLHDDAIVCPLRLSALSACVTASEYPDGRRG